VFVLSTYFGFWPKVKRPQKRRTAKRRDRVFFWQPFVGGAQKLLPQIGNKGGFWIFLVFRNEFYMYILILDSQFNSD